MHQPACVALFTHLTCGFLVSLRWHSWLYNLFVDFFSDDIKNSVDKALERAIRLDISNGVNSVLATLK